MADLRELIFGSPLPTHQAAEERLDNFRALAALSPDALASIAYANQEIYLGLVVAGAAGLAFAWPVALAIAGLLGMVALSYSQTIVAYPAGGGSYAVARENLSTEAGLVAAAALMTGYILNVAVSVTAGVAAVASVIPALWPYRVTVALILLGVVTLANLRGIRESGTAMSVPVYLFVGVYAALIVVGVARLIAAGSTALPAAAAPATADLTPFLLLHTFAAGCTALTGVEAISNGVTVFRPPEARNANRTLGAMAVLMAILFLGTIGLTQFMAVTPGAEETVLSALARRVFGPGLLHVAVQLSTLLMLVVAANTSFMGFPRLASIIARDGYLPRQLTLLGDRLVFSNGILVLSFLSAILVIVFGGDTHALIPLFAVGTFLAFTLSQAGMVRRWARERGYNWLLKAGLNGLGALATCAALLIIAVSRFIEGAWMALLLIPVQVAVFHQISRHYRSVAAQLTLRGLPPSLRPLPPPRLVLPISGVHRGTIEAVRFAQSVSRHVTAVYIELEPGSGLQMQRRWAEWGLDEDVKLEIVPSPYRSIVRPFIEFLDRTDHEHNDGQLATVLLPEFVPARWWQALLHNQTAWLIKLTILYRRRWHGKVRAIIDVPLHLRDE